ncbi:type II toxin-antitoxin system RelE/ParE family toxin [Pantoea cypripedii]|uniref:Addiction module toxin RelE n=1 Tax=Pantoea cypripedii TaxID=55209 RepID=A0A6B9GE96_PANCY|nr:type II toxin-antitoxin system RelE/ParE family toxin [Pantoea cypripedii]QGY31495.1 hypothetical protein CUN67_21115 [Pantoea cypripedii]
MTNYVLKPFDRNLKGTDVDNGKLCKAAKEVMAGHYEANLGGDVYKKRIPLNRGKSYGARVIIAFKSGQDLFFMNGWVKNDVKKNSKEIPDAELAFYKAVAVQLMCMTPEQAQIAIKAGKMREVKCDGESS